MTGRAAVLSSWPHLRHRLARHAGALYVGIIGLLAVLLAAGLASLPDPQLRTVLKATGETVRFAVANPDVAGFRVGRMRLVREEDEDDGNGVCVAGVVEPAKDAFVTYARVGSDRLVVRIEPGEEFDDARPVARFSRADEPGVPLSGSVRLVASPDCASGALPTRLPIQGHAEFGVEYAPPSATRDALAGYLSEGTLSVYGRSIDGIFGVRLHSTTTYEVMKVDIPSGSRIGALAGKGELPIWWGAARVKRDEPGFAIDASTAARVIKFDAPGAASGGHLIRLGSFEQITKDPNVIWLQVVFAFLTASIPIAVSGWKTVQAWRFSVLPPVGPPP